jgi:YHS domain-containing protein
MIKREINNTDYEDADIEGKLSDKKNNKYYVKYNGRTYTFSWNMVDVGDIEDALFDKFEDAGMDYFGDGGIDVSIDLSGDEDDLFYTIKLDFTNADDYANLTEISKADLEDFLDAVNSRINSEIDGTVYEDAELTGKLQDNDNASYNVKYNGRNYTFSWK